MVSPTSCSPRRSCEIYDALTGERVWEQPWPEADLSLLERETVEIVVQVNGKLRDRLQAPPQASREELEAMARDRPKVQQHVDGHDVVKVVVVPAEPTSSSARQRPTPRRGAHRGGRGAAAQAAAEDAGAAIADAGAVRVCGGLGGASGLPRSPLSRGHDRRPPARSDC